MNRENIIRMAREAGFILSDKAGEESIERFSNFAALVAAAERNSWPAEMEAMERQVNILTDALAQAKAEEREACAKVCDDIWQEDGTAFDCRESIRARGDK